ncbi:hypothetical protein STEG23_011796, partial [Scotinomys teguina]
KMTQTTVTVNGAEVASAHPQSTQVNIHIHHQSAWEQLLRVLGSPKKFLSCPQDMGPAKASIHHGQLALGVTQILLGLVSCVLGVCIYFGPWTELCASGCAFWSGSVAIVAGAGTIVHEKRQGKLSGHISRLLILACIATAVAATVLGVSSLIWQTSSSYYFRISSTCDPLQSSMGIEYGIMRYTSDSDWKIERCRFYLNMMMNLFLAFCIMLTIVCILKIVVSLASLGLSLRSMCGRSSQALTALHSYLPQQQQGPHSSKEKRRVRARGCIGTLRSLDTENVALKKKTSYFHLQHFSIIPQKKPLQIPKVCLELRVEYYAAEKNNDIMKFAGKRMELENVILSEAQNQDMDKDIGDCYLLCAPGPHVLLLVTQLGRFTAQDAMAVRRVKEIFGAGVMKHMIILFTHKEDLADETLDEFVVQECGRRYCAFNNRASGEEQQGQLAELMTVMRRLEQESNGSFYSNDLFLQAHVLLSGGYSDYQEAYRCYLLKDSSLD